MTTTDRLNAMLSHAAEAGDVPGVIAAAGNAGHSLFEGAAGKRSIDAAAAMTADTVTFFASMTKSVTAAAAMQMVERGKLSLDAPAAKVLPELDRVQVLEGFDQAGAPQLRPPRRAVTLRNLLTHTSGFSYEFWNADVVRWLEYRGIPGTLSGARATFDRPLMQDPQSRWDYGPGIDFAGRMVEEASGERLGEFVRRNLFEPLQMRSTAYRITPAQRTRLAGMHARQPDGSFAPYPFELDQNAEMDMGGHSIYGTAPDFLRFLRMFLNQGRLDGIQVLRPETVAAMSQNHIGQLQVRPLNSVMPGLSNSGELHPGNPCSWGLSFLINSLPTPEGRSANSLSWAGICNSYFWIDISRNVAGVMMTQVLPFLDERVVNLFHRFEKEIYQSLR